MISKKVVQMINEQINRELESAYIYKAMEICIGNNYNFDGIKNFFNVQVQEETAHAYLMIDYLNRLGEKVELKDIPKPKNDYTSILEIFEAALEHERKVTNWINEIMAVAVEEHDFASQNFFRYFVSEQVEEEETFVKHKATLKFIDGNPHAMLLFNDQLSSRVFTQPVINN